MIHEPHHPQDRKASLGALLGVPGDVVSCAIQMAALPLPSSPARLYVNEPQNEYDGREVTLCGQKNRMALVHVEDHIHLIIDASHLIVLPGGFCA